MTKNHTIRLLAAAVLALAGALPVSAAGRTITVSPGGPARSISEAISLASPGDTISVPPGVYHERIVVDKKMLHLMGVGNPQINGGGKGTVVDIKAPECVFEGFTVTGTGSSISGEDTGILLDSAAGSVVRNNILRDVLFGIYVRNSPHTVIRGNAIRGKNLPMPERGDGIRLWYSSGAEIEGNRLSVIRDLVIWWSSDTIVRNNVVEEGRYGLHYMSSNHNKFEDNVFKNNYVGAFLMYSKGIEFYRNRFISNRGTGTGYGVGFKDLDDVVAEGNFILDNRVGMFLDNSPYLIESWNEITGNMIAFNDVGVSLMPSIERNAFSSNSFTENEEQVEVRGGGRLAGNAWFKDGAGNYWSDYAGYDEDGDGVGEIPYRSESLFESLIDSRPGLRIFVFSPAARAMELASRAFPVIKPEPKLTDEHPLVRPAVTNGANEYAGRRSSGLLVLSASMAALSLALYGYITAGGRRA